MLRVSESVGKWTLSHMGWRINCSNYSRGNSTVSIRAFRLYLNFDSAIQFLKIFSYRYTQRGSQRTCFYICVYHIIVYNSETLEMPQILVIRLLKWIMIHPHIKNGDVDLYLMMWKQMLLSEKNQNKNRYKLKHHFKKMYQEKYLEECTPKCFLSDKAKGFIASAFFLTCFYIFNRKAIYYKKHILLL